MNPHSCYLSVGILARDAEVYPGRTRIVVIVILFEQCPQDSQHTIKWERSGPEKLLRNLGQE